MFRKGKDGILYVEAPREKTPFKKKSKQFLVDEETLRRIIREEISNALRDSQPSQQGSLDAVGKLLESFGNEFSKIETSLEGQGGEIQRNINNTLSRLEEMFPDIVISGLNSSQKNSNKKTKR